MLFPEKIQDYEYDAVIDQKITKFKISQSETRYIVIIFYPLDFTFVCPTELLRLSSMAEEFKKLDASIVFVSGDSVYSHLKWTTTSAEEGGIGPVQWPMISDICKKLSSQFNLFNEETGTVMRSTVIIDNNLSVKHLSANIDPIGRSSNEIIRLLKALHHNKKYGEVCAIDFEA